jgi:hypothetical protein
MNGQASWLSFMVVCDGGCGIVSISLEGATCGAAAGIRRKILAAHRCSHLLSSSRGILVITRTRGSRFYPCVMTSTLTASERSRGESAADSAAPIGLSSSDGRFDYGRIVHWKVDKPKCILGTCPNRVIDPVDAARFMTAASKSWRRARSAALNAPCAARPSRVGTPLGCLDIGSSPVQPGQSPQTPLGTSTSSQRFADEFRCPEFPDSPGGRPRIVEGVMEPRGFGPARILFAKAISY